MSMTETMIAEVDAKLAAEKAARAEMETLAIIEKAALAAKLESLK